jgi:Fur family peroxide stress response transcriptional regulator
MNLATMYRNIVLIKLLGEVLELGFPDGNNRYDGNKPYPHPHLICIK